MAKYELKRGVVLQVFGDPTKTCTAKTLTDEIGAWYHKHHPEKMIYFSKFPIKPVVTEKTEPEPETKKIITTHSKPEPDLVAQILGEAQDAQAKINEPKKTAPVKTEKTEVKKRSHHKRTPNKAK